MKKKGIFMSTNKYDDINTILKETLEANPEIPSGIIQEYIDNLKTVDMQKALGLADLLKNKDFYTKFATSIMQMSLLLSAAMSIPEDGEQDAEFIKIKKKILFEARKDLKEIFEMRMIYLNNITPSELSHILIDEDEINTYLDRIDNFKKDYQGMVHFE